MDKKRKLFKSIKIVEGLSICKLYMWMVLLTMVFGFTMIYINTLNANGLIMTQTFSANILKQMEKMNEK